LKKWGYPLIRDRVWYVFNNLCIILRIYPLIINPNERVFSPMNSLKLSWIFPLSLVGSLLLSGCSDKEAMTDPELLDRATLGCFHTSFSYAKKRNHSDLPAANVDFKREVYNCMVRNILGENAAEDAKRAFAEAIEKQCPFTKLETIVRTDMVECMKNEALPIVLKNRDQLAAGK
jgi:hypothetical protein